MKEMKEMEVLAKAIDFLQPYWPEIQDEMGKHQRRFEALVSTDHDAIGRVLRAHLVVENFVDTFLSDFYGIEDLEEIKLSFAQKAKLLPTKNSPSVIARKGITQLNTVRNKLGHRIDHEISMKEIDAIVDVLGLVYPGVNYESPIIAIEAFTPIACAVLSTTPHYLKQPFHDAFSRASL